jgi:hypothetical protein
MHAKFMELGMHVPHFIVDVLTKWHIQLLHILAAIVFLSPIKFEF